MKKCRYTVREPAGFWKYQIRCPGGLQTETGFTTEEAAGWAADIARYFLHCAGVLYRSHKYNFPDRIQKEENIVPSEVTLATIDQHRRAGLLTPRSVQRREKMLSDVRSSQHYLVKCINKLSRHAEESAALPELVEILLRVNSTLKEIGEPQNETTTTTTTADTGALRRANSQGY